MTVPFVPLEYTGPFPVKAEVYTYENPSTWERFDFGLEDSKGRAIGAAVLRQRCDVLPLKAEEYSIYGTYYHVKGTGRLRLGTGLFLVRFHATRGGANFGSWPPHHYFTSEEEQEARIQKYLKEAKKRAEKTAKR